MNELIKITEHDGKRAVNARELHQFLESKQDFSTWIKSRVEKYEFVEGQDFITAPQIYGTANGGHATRTEYALSLDMAKELSMVENNERGRMARKYFIECEKKANTPVLDDFDKKLKTASWLASYLNLSDASKLLIAQAIAKPFGLPVPDYVTSKGVHHSASELLKKHCVGMSVVKFNEKLMEKGFLVEATRKGTNKLHKFKVISDKGLEFGENVVSAKNQNETQPHWYDEKFEELINIIN